MQGSRQGCSQLGLLPCQQTTAAAGVIGNFERAGHGIHNWLAACLLFYCTLTTFVQKARQISRHEV
jgi:hypothetical protein